MAQRWMVLLVLLGLVLENSLVLTRSRQARQASEEEEEELAEGNTRNPALILVQKSDRGQIALVFLYKRVTVSKSLSISLKKSDVSDLLVIRAIRLLFESVFFVCL